MREHEFQMRVSILRITASTCICWQGLNFGMRTCKKPKYTDYSMTTSDGPQVSYFVTRITPAWLSLVLFQQFSVLCQMPTSKNQESNRKSRENSGTVSECSKSWARRFQLSQTQTADPQKFYWEPKVISSNFVSREQGDSKISDQGRGARPVIVLRSMDF